MQCHSSSFVSAASSVSPWLNTGVRPPVSLGSSISTSVDRHVAAQEHLYLEGEIQSHIFLVLSGVIGSYKLLPDGRRQICAFSYPGDILGIECEQWHLNHAEALSETVVRSIPATAIDKLIMSEPGFGQALLRITAMELASTREQLLSLGRKTAKEKLATFLLNIARRHALPGMSEAQFDLPMKRYDIADYLGLTVETVSRNFTRLKTSGMIRLVSSQRVQVDDMNLLEITANGGDSIRLH
ncbi:MAG: helix-turn-helix domain-containing protein [Granulosicoccus sp.]